MQAVIIRMIYVDGLVANMMVAMLEAITKMILADGLVANTKTWVAGQVVNTMKQPIT